MKMSAWFHARDIVCLLTFLCMSPTLSYGAVTADPATATFTSPQQSVIINLTNDGVPIPKKDISGWQLFASGHDYQHMLTVETMDGALKIAPSKTLEVGSYDLNIETTEGSVIVHVFAPLSDLPDIVTKTAALTGLSEQKIQEKLGLTTELGHDQIQLELPPVYYEGQTLELSMPPRPGREAFWFVNGDPVNGGTGRNNLVYTFREPGEYVVTYIETETMDGKTSSVARSRAYTRAVSMPGIQTEVTVNTEIEFLPPAGYRNHVWRIDGQEVSVQPVLKYSFKDPGVHTVECLASSPGEGPAQGFSRIRYNTIVNQK